MAKRFFSALLSLMLILHIAPEIQSFAAESASFNTIDEIFGAPTAVLEEMDYEFNSTSVLGDELKTLNNTDWPGTVSFSDDGATYDTTKGNAYFYINNGGKTVLDEGVATVVSFKLCETSGANFYFSYWGSLGLFSSAVFADHVQSVGGSTVSTDFSIGTSETSLLFMPKKDECSVYIKNDSSNNKWVLLHTVSGYRSSNTYGVFIAAGYEKTNGSVLKSVKSYEAIVVDKDNSSDTIYDGEVAINGIKNISFGLGEDSSKRNLTWFSESAEPGVVTWQKFDEMIDGDFTASAKTATATRDDYAITYTGTHYNNKAVIYDLEPDTVYCYQLSNGEDKSGIVPFKTGSNTTSFSFAFIADPQISSGDPDENGTTGWGRTLN